MILDSFDRRFHLGQETIRQSELLAIVIADRIG